MARIVASMADVSTDYNPCDPGVARLQIESVEEVTNAGRTHYVIKSTIVEYTEGGKEEDVGRSITSRVHVHKKDGTLNAIGLSQLKRYFEVTVGEERANSPEADTDELVGQQFVGQIGIRSYSVNNTLTGESEERQSNELERLASL